MSEWKEYKLGEIVTFQRGHDLPKDKMIDGDIPVAGSNGIIGYHNQFTKEGPGVTIGRSGNIGIPHYYPNAYWAHNTVLYIIDFKGNDTKFMYYLLKTFDFTQLNTGSAVPSLNRNHIHELPVSIPELPTQHRIASILSSLDDKIDLLHRENKTLEAMAETLFRQWFIEEAKEDWKEVLLEEIAYLSAGGDKPKNVSSNRTNELNIPIYSNGIEDEGLYGYTDTPKITEESVTISARGTIGYVVLRTEPFVPIVRLITLTPKKNITSKYLYFWAKSQDINGTGTTQQQLTIPDFKLTKVLLPEKEFISKFTNEVDKYYEKILLNKKQIQTLIQQRDSLLPKLMSGEVKI